MFSFLITTIFVILIVKFALQKFFKKTNKGFWEKHGILELDGTKIVSESDILLGKRDITERDDYAYKHIMGDTHKFCGMSETPYPLILIKDLDLIKKVLIKNFDNFVDRRPFFGAAREDSVLRKMLGNLQGDEWKGVRASVTPTFTTGKIRRMMEYVNSVGVEWVTVLKERAETNGYLLVDAYSIASNYTVDVIASAIFGLQAGTVRNPNSTFSTMANRLVNMTTFQTIKFTLSLRFPKLFRFFNIDIMDMEAMSFFEKILNQNLQARMSESGGEKRNDFLELLIEARKGELEEGKLETKKQQKRQYLTDQVVNGMCMGFFFAGFRTTSTFITFVVYSLALHQDVQDKLRKEVEKVFGEDGSMDYETLGQIVYLDMVISEILRLFPATLRLERLCVSDFHDTETGLFIPRGCMVGIPLYSLHNDKRFYKNPDKFDPEHFNPEIKAERNPYTYMPFGMGPRNCIGMRFALVEAKAALTYLVHNFRILPTDKTPKKLEGKRVNYQHIPPANLEVKLVPLQ